jgi:Tol biopolymer transport system component
VTCDATNSITGGNDNSTQPLFSPDGRWIAFSSRAGNLTTNSTAARAFWALDSQTKTKRNISSLYFVTNSIFSGDSRFIVFDTYNWNSPSASIIFLHDLTTSILTNTLVYSNARNPAVSYNAEVVAMQSLPTNSITHVFAKHLPSDTMELISVAPDGLTPGNGASSPPQITANGRFVLFSSKANNLVYGDTNGCSDIFLRDRQLSLTYLLSANPKTGRPGNRPSTSPLMSSDGSTIIFASMANDLAHADYNDKQDIFVVKLVGGDSDSDGLDDTWEMAYFGNLDRDGSGDFDGDGLTDREEYRAGTDPTNQGSVLRALLLAPVGGSQTTLVWPGKAGRQYKVQFKRSVNDADWTDLTTTITLNGNVASAVDDQAGLDAARFYRILLLP